MNSVVEFAKSNYVATLAVILLIIAVGFYYFVYLKDSKDSKDSEGTTKPTEKMCGDNHIENYEDVDEDDEVEADVDNYDEN